MCVCMSIIRDAALAMLVMLFEITVYVYIKQTLVE